MGEVVRAALPEFSKGHCLPVHHGKTLRAIAACHTAALGGHRYQCSHCGKEHFVPHSCGNRHCPSCQKLKSAQWLEEQVEHLLPVPYFHVVFTLPHGLNPLIAHNQKLLYRLLFTSATATLLEFGRNNLHATLGITAVLHTWSQNLLDHYHLHCVVTGGGVSLDGKRWVGRGPKWLFPVKALSKVYRGKFREGLTQLFEEGKLRFPKAKPELSDPLQFASWRDQLCRPNWVVYAKQPLAGPEAVLAYLCRYTHRVAIANRRIQALDLEARTVTFEYKDYAHQSQIRSMTLTLEEFLRRFCLHILPPGFVKIRNYGLLSHRNRADRIAQARALIPVGPTMTGSLPWEPPKNIKHVEAPPLLCPHCGRPTLVLIEIVDRPKKPFVHDSS